MMTGPNGDVKTTGTANLARATVRGLTVVAALATLIAAVSSQVATAKRGVGEVGQAAGVFASALGPVAVRRGAPAPLDASFSSSTLPIAEYRWDFAPGPSCPAGTLLTNTSTASPDPVLMVQALCDLAVTLTVTDEDGNRDTDTTRVDVFARISQQWQPTTLDLLSPGPSGDPRTPRDEFDLARAPFTQAMSVSRCRRDARPRWLCPRTDVAGTLDGRAYEVIDISDPGGPFDGYWFVVANHVLIKQSSLFNPSLFKTSTVKHRDPFHPGRRVNWFRVNRMAHRPVMAMVAAVRKHENWGSAGSAVNPNNSGHAGAKACYLKSSPHLHNPAIVLEALFRTGRGDLTAAADLELRRISVELKDAAADPLPVIWTGRLLYWNSAAKRWRLTRDWIGEDPSSPIECP
jgi:hypothetical protein